MFHNKAVVTSNIRNTKFTLENQPSHIGILAAPMPTEELFLIDYKLDNCTCLSIALFFSDSDIYVKTAQKYTDQMSQF